MEKKTYKKTSMKVLLLELQSAMLVSSDEYYYQGAPDD